MASKKTIATDPAHETQRSRGNVRSAYKRPRETSTKQRKSSRNANEGRSGVKHQPRNDAVSRARLSRHANNYPGGGRHPASYNDLEGRRHFGGGKSNDASEATMRRGWGPAGGWANRTPYPNSDIDDVRGGVVAGVTHGGHDDDDGDGDGDYGEGPAMIERTTHSALRQANKIQENEEREHNSLPRKTGVREDQEAGCTAGTNGDERHLGMEETAPKRKVEESLDDKLPLMLASLERVALTVHDLQGRCARLSQGEQMTKQFSPFSTILTSTNQLLLFLANVLSRFFVLVCFMTGPTGHLASRRVPTRCSVVDVWRCYNVP